MILKYEKRERWEAKEGMLGAIYAIDSILRQIRHAGLEASIRVYLRWYDRSRHDQLFGRDQDADGFQEVRRKASKGLRAWLQGRHLDSSIRGNTHYLHAVRDTHSLSNTERAYLYHAWIANIVRSLQAKLSLGLALWEDHKMSYDCIRGEIDLRVLTGANVIGVTTTALARHLKHLRNLTSKVLLVEEAGEVLEAHLLTAILPSIEHAILIGDHQQLRPKVQNNELSCENPRSKIGLDISLFERLVQPAEGAAGVPYTTLEVQRRMHPSISNLIRLKLYPNLQDDPAVSKYPEATSMRHRFVWLNHKHTEDGKNKHMHSTSRTNSHEAGVVTAIVQHLVRQGVYEHSDIAVLTPYRGQMHKLRQASSDSFQIVLNDRDIDELAKDGVDDSDMNPEERKIAAPLPPRQLNNGILLPSLRLATVDNFQGEEAKVVVISLVRSNEQGKCGFLRTPNRINVLLSRAQHGTYIIGNANTASHIHMWHQVLELFRQNGNSAEHLELCCPRHPETPLLVRNLRARSQHDGDGPSDQLHI